MASLPSDDALLTNVTVGQTRKRRLPPSLTPVAKLCKEMIDSFATGAKLGGNLRFRVWPTVTFVSKASSLGNSGKEATEDSAYRAFAGWMLTEGIRDTVLSSICRGTGTPLYQHAVWNNSLERMLNYNVKARPIACRHNARAPQAAATPVLSLRHGDGQERAPCEAGLLSDPLPHLPPAESGLPGAEKLLGNEGGEEGGEAAG